MDSSTIVGTWRLISLTERNLATSEVSFPMGTAAQAMVIYTADGFVATVFTGSDRTAPAGTAPSTEEAARLYRSMIAFAGRYAVAGDKLIYHPEIAWNPTWEDTVQERQLEFRDGHLRATGTASGAQTAFTMEWEREPVR